MQGLLKFKLYDMKFLMTLIFTSTLFIGFAQSNHDLFNFNPIEETLIVQEKDNIKLNETNDFVLGISNSFNTSNSFNVSNSLKTLNSFNLANSFNTSNSFNMANSFNTSNSFNVANSFNTSNSFNVANSFNISDHLNTLPNKLVTEVLQLLETK